MNSPARPFNNTRRRFMRDATCLAAAATGAVSIVDQAIAEKPEPSDVTKVIDLGVRPTLAVHGAIIVPSGSKTFVCFTAESQGSEGLAVIELEKCKSWKSSVPGENPLDTANRDALETCNTFEVLNSSWVASQSEQKDGSTEKDAKKLRHFVITFLGAEPGVAMGGKHFECLAEDIHAEFLPPGPFEDVLDYIDFVAAKS